MKRNDIFIAYVSWGGAGKHRPLLFRRIDTGGYRAFTITSKYDPEKYTHRVYYYKIRDWESAGLRKPSYIDASQLLSLKKADCPVVGTLSNYDAAAFLKFCVNSPALC